MSQSVDVVVKRIIQAPIEVLWEIWTDAEQISKWWGPKNFTATGCEIDLRVGGRILLGMKSAEFMGGHESFTVGEFSEIVLHERLVFGQSMADADGNPIDPASVGVSDFPDVVNTIVEFRKLSDEFSEVTVTQQGFPPTMMSALAYAGWQQSIDKISSLITGA